MVFSVYNMVNAQSLSQLNGQMPNGQINQQTLNADRTVGTLEHYRDRREAVCTALRQIQALTVAQWCQNLEKVPGPVNTSKHPNLSEICFLALFLWLYARAIDLPDLTR